MKKYILILVVLFLTSCTFNKTYRNREEDKKEAEKITEKYYQLIKETTDRKHLNYLEKSFLIKSMAR